MFVTQRQSAGTINEKKWGGGKKNQHATNQSANIFLAGIKPALHNNNTTVVYLSNISPTITTNSSRTGASIQRPCPSSSGAKNCSPGASCSFPHRKTEKIQAVPEHERRNCIMVSDLMIPGASMWIIQNRYVEKYHSRPFLQAWDRGKRGDE